MPKKMHMLDIYSGRSDRKQIFRPKNKKKKKMMTVMMKKKALYQWPVDCDNKTIIFYLQG